MKAIISFLFLICLVTTAFSQAFGQMWASRYNGPGNANDFAYKLAVDNSGNVYVTGYSTGATSGKDMFTVKYNSGGSAVWTARYNGPVNGGDYSFAIVLDQNGNSYVTGRSDRGSSTFSDITTIKYDVNGNQQWAALYDGAIHSVDEGEALLVDNSGNVFVTGKAYVSSSSSYDIVTIKYNSSGAEQWVKIYNGTANNNDVPYAMATDNSGNIYVCGVSVMMGSGSDYVLLKYNPDGTQAWVKTYNGPVNGGDGAFAICVDGSGSVYITGTCYAGNLHDYDFATLKYDGSGNRLWVKTFNGPGSRADFANAMTLDNIGNVVVTGTSVSGFSQVDSNFATLKYSPNGDVIWTAYYSRSGSSSDVSRAITSDIAGNVYVTGNSSLVGTAEDYTTIKYSPDGVPLWIFLYNGPDNNNDITSSIAIDNIGSIYVTGRSYSVLGGYDYTTIKYGNLVGLSQSGSNIPKTFGLYQNYPNPFNPVTRFRFDIPKNSPVELIVYDVQGKAVINKYFGIIRAGEYEYVLDAGKLGLTSGVYFYSIRTNDYTGTKKMVLVK